MRGGGGGGGVSRGRGELVEVRLLAKAELLSWEYMGSTRIQHTTAKQLPCVPENPCLL